MFCQGVLCLGDANSSQEEATIKNLVVIMDIDETEVEDIFYLEKTMTPTLFNRFVNWITDISEG